MQVHPFLPIILAGTLKRDFIITPGGKAISDTPGGHLFHTALGLSHIERQFGMVSRIGIDYPAQWLEDFQALGADTRGIKQTGVAIDQRFFIRHDDSGQKSTLAPLAHYAEEGLPFPKGLLGYPLPTRKPDSLTLRNGETIIARDIPHDYLESPTIHICPMDYLTHNLITQHFTQTGGKRISIRAGKGYMSPLFLPYLPTLLNGLNTFFTNESQIRNLFSEKRFHTVGDMARQVMDWGVEIVVIQFEDYTNCLFAESGRENCKLAPYPVTIKNKTGIKDSFCGGFIGNLSKSYNASKALVSGMTAASFAMEANKPYYATDIIEGLFSAREAYLADRLIHLN